MHVCGKLGLRKYRFQTTRHIRLSRVRPALISAFLVFFIPYETISSETQTTTTLRKIRTPLDLLDPLLPSQYAVPVQLSGNIADEMALSILNLELPPPEYREIRSRSDGFRLELTNDQYTSRTRKLLSGVLNPIEMIDAVLENLLELSDEKGFSKLTSETEIRTIRNENEPDSLIRYQFVPKGDRFHYEYRDYGAAVTESWLLKLELLLDTSAMLAMEITTTAVNRKITASPSSLPQVDTTVRTYRTVYDTIDGRMVPAMLEVLINATPTLRISAKYRMEGKHAVFDKREICCSIDNSAPRCLVIGYGTYDLGRKASRKERPRPSGNAVKLKHAAALTFEASQALRTGEIETAVRLMNTIAEKYPGTPQAAEARELLRGLPDF